MARRIDPTPEVARARRYAARVRVLLALVGGLLLAIDPSVTSYPVPAAIGFAVIGVTGVVEWAVQSERSLGVEEALSCVAVVCMVGWSAGELNLVSVLWLVAAASGVRRIVKLSSIEAVPGSPAAFWDWHGRVEHHLRASEIPAVVLRSSFFMSNMANE